jgi:hypothetical protein
MVGGRHFRRLGGGQPGAVGLDLQGVREVDEQPLGGEDDPDGQHALCCHAEPVEAGVGTGDAVDPPVPRPDRGAGVGGGPHSVETISASRAVSGGIRSLQEQSTGTDQLTVMAFIRSATFGCAARSVTARSTRRA